MKRTVCAIGNVNVNPVLCSVNLCVAYVNFVDTDTSYFAIDVCVNEVDIGYAQVDKEADSIGTELPSRYAISVADCKVAQTKVNCISKEGTAELC